MLVCAVKDVVLFRTQFNEQYDLIQKFRGLDYSVKCNHPIDYMESGLMQRNKWDYWHIDKPFSISTDEAPPLFVNNSYIGANHGHHGAIRVYAPNHSKTFKDIGTLWKDDSGAKFTLLSITSVDYLTFISENIGESIEKYTFVCEIKGKLSCLENSYVNDQITPNKQSVVDLVPSIRHKEKKVVAFINGKENDVYGEIDCDYAEIRETYDIINPATVAKELRDLRSVDSFKIQPDLSQFGKAMISCSMIYRVLQDGTILTFFNVKKLMNVNVQKVIGVMFQEKLDVFGGGIWRYLPKILPFSTPEGSFDFSKPLNICVKKYPKNISLTREYWKDKNSPCERVVDYFRDNLGHNKLAFACGFLPLYDGQPSVRKKQTTEAVHLLFTRKFYPTFINCDKDIINGVCYKKYFIPKLDNGSVYTIHFENKKYIFIDFFGKKEFKLKIDGNVSLIEKDDEVSYSIKNNNLIISGKKGCCVFCIE